MASSRKSSGKQRIIAELRSMERLAAVVFDMDGVLVDSEIHWKKVQSDYLQGLIPTWNAERQAGIIGMSAHDVYQHLVRDHGLTKSKAEYFTFYRNISHEIYGVKSSLIPGSRELLVQLAEVMPVALASSSPRAWIDIVVERFSLSGYLRAIVSADDVGGKGKPDPAIYQMTAERLSVAPKSCLAIEDTEKGIASAKRAGMSCIGLRNGFNEGQNLAAADRVIDGFAAISREEILKCSFE